MRHPAGLHALVSASAPFSSSRSTAARAVGSFNDSVTKERFLVAESRIEAGPFDAHRAGQIGKGSAFVSFFPENPHGGVESFVCVKTARPAHLRAWTVRLLTGIFCTYGVHVQ